MSEDLYSEVCRHGVHRREECNYCDPSDTSLEAHAETLSDDRLNELMASQGRPSLATLYQQGKSSGLIKPQLDYAHASA